MKVNLLTRIARRLRSFYFQILLVIVIFIYILRALTAMNEGGVTSKSEIIQALNDDFTKFVPTTGKRSVEELTATNTSNRGTFANYSLHPDFIYTLENPTLCSSTLDLRVVVIVHSAPLHVEHRQAIRDTWTNSSHFPLLGIKTLFLLGKVKKPSHQDSIQREFDRYGDILQGDFIDDYHNLTYKAIMGYKWLTERCRNARVILKTDDDVVVNTFKFIKDILPRFLTSPRQIVCRRAINAPIYRNIRSKWYMPKDILKGETKYYDFCFGVMVIISNDIVPEMYQASLTTDFLWTDDVFMYGYVARKVKSIQYKSLVFKSDIIKGTDLPIRCYKLIRDKCPFLAIMVNHHVPQMMRQLWRLIVNLQAT